MKFYNEEPPAKIGPHGDRSWSCPGCRGLCTCAACKRQQSKRESKKKNALASQQAAAQAATQAGADGKEGHTPVFSSTQDSKDSSKAMKTESRPSPSSDEWKSGDEGVKDEQVRGGEARSEESNGAASLLVPNGTTSSPAASTVVSPATTQSTVSSSGGTALMSSTSVSGSSQSDTPPSHLHHLPLSSVVTPAPVYSSLSSGFTHSPGMAMSSLGGSLSSSPLMPVNMSLHGLGFPSSFLSPQTSYTSLSNLPLFPSSAFSSSPPSSPFPHNPHQLMLPHLSTPHLASLGLPSSLSASSASSSPSLESGSFNAAGSLMPLTSASPITWQRSLRAAQLPAPTASTPSPEQGSPAQ